MENQRDRQSGDEIAEKRKKATRHTLTAILAQLTAILQGVKMTRPTVGGTYAAHNPRRPTGRKANGAAADTWPSDLTRHLKEPSPTMPDPYTSTQKKTSVLKQVHPDGKTYTVQNFSRTLRAHERSYPMSELQCLAIVESVVNFRVSLMGRKFTIFSDHHALQRLTKIKNPSGRLFRWRLRLSRYEYELQEAVFHIGNSSYANPCTVDSVATGHASDLEAVGLCAAWIDRPRPVRTPATVSKVKRLATTENPPSQRQLSRMCGTSLKTINNIIHKDLELDTRRKGKVHKLTPFHMKNRATNARKLYEEHLAGSRSEYTATLDEAWMYVTYCNGIRKICYIKRGNQVPDNWVHQCSETFLKGFMVVGVMTGRGVLPLIKVPSKVKVKSEFYIECVLKPVIEQLKDLYPGEMDKVFLHHDKASSHTSNKTQQFLQEMKDTLGINFIRNSDIPVKSPDASPLDFYRFGMLKQRLFNRRPKTEAGLWKAAQEEWSNVSLSKVKEVFAAWKVRCREIAKKKGKHIEHMKKIHVRKIKF
ncbi:K02A2.6-like [Cordylochernes scorpioides]|uniref:K02A2.6-like n=1 Tax=Cordylochernes scorpioides TaxID=51811 RepID=A0ABY6KL42_9ARAC|nr:K02A2.6-like [Cordylochernes scorpioides]